MKKPKTSSPAQQLARARNWQHARIKQASSTLEELVKLFNLPGKQFDLAAINILRETLLKCADRFWNAEKAKL